MFSDYISPGKKAGKDDEVNAGGTVESLKPRGGSQAKTESPSTLLDSQAQSLNKPYQEPAQQTQPLNQPSQPLNQQSQLLNQQSQPLNQTPQSINQNLKPLSQMFPPSNKNNANPIKNSNHGSGYGFGAAGLALGAGAATAAFPGAVIGGALGAAVGGLGAASLSAGLGASGLGANKKWTILNYIAADNDVLNKKHVFTEDEARAEVEDMANHLDADGTSLVEEQEECVIIDGLRLDKK